MLKRGTSHLLSISATWSSLNCLRWCSLIGGERRCCVWRAWQCCRDFRTFVRSLSWRGLCLISLSGFILAGVPLLSSSSFIPPLLSFSLPPTRFPCDQKTPTVLSIWAKVKGSSLYELYYVFLFLVGKGRVRFQFSNAMLLCVVLRLDSLYLIVFVRVTSR